MRSEKQFRKRNAILAYLRQTKEHPSAEMVYARLKPEYPDLSLGTVYRNLSLFKQQGEIISIGTLDGVERFDGHTQPHVHFFCTQCGQVLDVPQLPACGQLSTQAEACVGGEIHTCQITFTGVCSVCNEKSLQGGETA